MKALIPMDEYGVYADTKDMVRVDSRFVADTFQKDHKNVLRDIERLIAPESGLEEDFSRLNFEPSTYKDSRGKKQPCFQMTKDGFTLLTFGYTGKKAMKFKVAYIRRFNEMEAFIQDLVAARMECPELTDSIQRLHEEPKAHHFKNEFDMINRIALGMSAKQFREEHEIPAGKSIRPYLTEKQISDIRRLQHMDAGLALAVRDYQERKRILTEFKASALDAQQAIG